MSIHKYTSKKAKHGYLYQVRIYIGQNQYGKAEYKTKRGFKTLKEAKEYEGQLIHLKATGKLSELVKATKRAYKELFEEWFDTYQGTVEITTAKRTEELFRLHILPVMGDKPINNISPLDCQRFITDKAKTFKNIKQIKSYTSKIFDFAIRNKLLQYNPMSEVIMPKRKPKTISNFWTVQELQEFLAIVHLEEPYKDFTLFRLLAYSGLRKGELYALKWADMDFQTATLSISKSLGRVDGKAIEKDTKNRFSVRKIKLDSETVEILAKWKQLYKQEIGQLTIAPFSIEEDYIFTYCTRAGSIEPLHADYINKLLDRIIKRHKLNPISPHGFRHTHATLMIEIGVDPVNTAKRLGHASSQMTLDTYSHATVAGGEKSIQKFAEYLAEKSD